MAQALGLREREKAGIQQELIPEAVGGATEEVVLPLDTQPQLPLGDYAAEAETFGDLPGLQ